MKKIYALLAASLVTGSAMAATKAPQPKHVEAVKPGIEKIVEAAHADLFSGKTGETFKMKKAGAAGQYLVRASKNQERFIDLISGSYTFEERPYYWFTISFEDENGSIAVFDYIIPCIAYLYGEMTEDPNFWGGDYESGEFDWDYATTYYGSLEEAQRAPTLTEIGELVAPYGLPMYPYGYLGAFVCWDYNTSTWMGQGGYHLRPGVITPQGTVDYTDAAWYMPGPFDAEMEEIECSFIAPIGTQSGTSFGTLVGTMNPNQDDVNEAVLVTGWAPNEMEIGEVHIFNLGAAEDFTWTYNGQLWHMTGSTSTSCYEDYEPAQMYYMIFCSPQLGIPETQYGEADLPRVPVIMDSAVAIDQINWYRAYFTLAPNDDPENVYPQGTAELNINDYAADNLGYLKNPMHPGMVFGSYYMNASKDYSAPLAYNGMLGQFYGATSVPKSTMKGTEVIGVCTFGIGDQTNGFYGNLTCDDGTMVDYQYMGDVNYHYDESDYRVMKTIPATTGVKSVATDSPVVGTEYFNLQGVRMNAAPQNGLYIVREKKADGTVVSRKVAK